MANENEFYREDRREIPFTGFNDHKEYEGKHAFLSPSKHTWLKWDNETLLASYRNSFKQSVGTILHELAKELISNCQRLRKSDYMIIVYKMNMYKIPPYAYDLNLIWDNFMRYVNDAIGFKMKAEKVVIFSPVAFGTVDTIRYDPVPKVLRIHDYKSGDTPCTIDQLMIYAAYFCLEYKQRPNEIILRLYQTDNNIQARFINTKTFPDEELSDEKGVYDIMIIEDIMRIIESHNNVLAMRGW